MELAVPTILGLLFFGFYLYKKREQRVEELKQKYKQRSSSNTTTHHNQRSRHRRHAPHHSDVINAVNQILETTSIMSTSKNIDTIEGRWEFLKKRLETLRWASMEDGYKTKVQRGLDQYKTTYYNKDVYGWQVSILMNPYGHDIHKFYAKCIFRGFTSYYEHQLDEIGNLKMDYAIENRYQNLLEKLEEIRNILSSITGSSTAIKYVKSIQSDLEEIDQSIQNKLN